MGFNAKTTHTPLLSGKPGKSLLHEAAALGLHHLAAQLVSKGLDVDGVDPANGWTPVHYACHNGSVPALAFVHTPGRKATRYGPKELSSTSMVRSTSYIVTR